MNLRKQKQNYQAFRDVSGDSGRASWREEFRVLQYDDVIDTPVRDCGERLVALHASKSRIVCQYQRSELAERYGNVMFVRESALQKLESIQELLANSSDFPQGTRLLVAYGYRSLSDQIRFFEQARMRMRERYPDANEAQLTRLANLEAAAPEVAGHPTGGAVDVTLLLPEGEELDVGSTIGDFSDPEIYPVLSSKVSQQQLANRIKLRELMLAEGFAPFNGEWWHFSYGDKEWAAFYGEPVAIYAQVELENSVA